MCEPVTARPWTGGALAGVCGAGVTAQRAHTGERGLTSPPWKGRATRTHASPASHSVYVDGPFCLRRSQPLNRPGKRNPRPLPNQATTPPSDLQRPGALPTHTCLSAGLTAWEGASPTFPCPSARLTGASRQETPPAPQFMAISTSDGHGRVGASPGPVGGQGGHVPALGGPRAAALPQARLTGGGRRGPPAGPASDRASPLTHIRAVTPPAGLSGVCARVGREGRESGELGGGGPAPWAAGEVSGLRPRGENGSTGFKSDWSLAKTLIAQRKSSPDTRRHNGFLPCFCQAA